MKRVLTVAGLATVAVLGASTLAAAAAGAQGTTSVVGVQVSASGYATGVDDRGDVIGGYNVDNVPHGFIWHAGTFTDLGALPGDNHTDASAVDDRGDVVGDSYAQTDWTTTNAQAFVWHDGAMTALPGPAGENVFAKYINDSGEIVGAEVPGSGQNTVVVWQNGKLSTLPGLGGANTTATGLNRDGEVVGYADTASGGSSAVAWINGKAVALGPGIPVAVNDDGAVLVENSPTDGPFQAYVWSDGKATDLPVGTVASGFNDEGEVVGLYTASNSSPTVGFTWRDGTLTDLGSQSPVAINNRGQILFYVYDNGLFSSSVLDRDGKTVSLLPTAGPSASVGFLSESGLVAGESESAANVTAWQLPNG